MVNLLLNSGAALLKSASVPPITYLTQWRMMGNSVVHTDEYLTQWKVEGNSVVDNNVILSCGDLGQDGYYHVKISNGVDVFDIALTEPLRKVNDVADTIEFANGVATVTRNFAKAILSDLTWTISVISSESCFYRTESLIAGKSIKPIKPAIDGNTHANVLCSIYDTIGAYNAYIGVQTGIGVERTKGYIYLYDANYNQEGDLTAFLAHINGVELIYELATPTTETIQVSPFPISATDTYTSANDTPYSAFEFKKNVEIWSCGEYNAVDGKYHILVQPLGGSIVDITLDEPLRKVNDVADSIEFVNGVATLTRNFASVDLGSFSWTQRTTNTSGIYRYSTTVKVEVLPNCIVPSTKIAIALCPKYSIINPDYTYGKSEGIGLSDASNLANGQILIYDSNANTLSASDFRNYLQGVELIYQITPITETIQVPQIQEADSYSCVISQGGKAVSWSDFETE